MACKILSDAEHNYQRHSSLVDGDDNLPADVPAYVPEDLNDILAQKALWEGDRISSFMVDDRFVIYTALPWLPKTIPTSGSEFAKVVRWSVHEVEAPRTVTAKAEKEFQRQNELISIAEKWANIALNNIASLFGRIAVAGTLKAEMPSSASGASSQVAVATAKQRHVRHTTATQSKEMENIALLKISIKRLEDDMAF